MNIGNNGEENVQGALIDGDATLPSVSFASDSSTSLGVSVEGSDILDVRNNAIIFNVDVLEQFNVLYHGMDNTSQTNCSAIMTTLVTISASTGPSIYFPRVTYLFTSLITFISNKKGFRIYGEGKETVIIDDLSSNASLWWFQNARQITVDSIYFDGDRWKGSLLQEL